MNISHLELLPSLYCVLVGPCICSHLLQEETIQTQPIKCGEGKLMPIWNLCPNILMSLVQEGTL